MTTNSKPSEPRRDLTRAAKVWVQLAEMFAKAFLRENGDEPTVLWQQAIWRLTDAQIATGLANLGNDGLKFPPNLSQFLEACKRSKPVRYLGVKQLPDLRERGHMSYAEWREKHGCADENS